MSSKDELLVEALGVCAPEWFATLDELAESDQPVEAQLTLVANQVLDFFGDHLPKMHAIFACGVNMKKQILREDTPPVQGVRAFTSYFANLRRQERIGLRDPEIIARMIVGALHHYAFAEFAGLNDVLPMLRETYVRGVVATVLGGIERRESS